MRLSFPPAPSYYAAVGPAPERDAVRGEIRADVCVLGGGIAGCSAALHLAKRGYKVALLEARAVGYGASGRSGGQTIFGLAVGQQKLIAQVGRDDAHRLFGLTIEALELTQSLIREHAIDCDYCPNHVHVAVKPRHVRELEQWSRELLEEYAYGSVRMLGRDEVQSHVQSDRYLAGLLDSRPETELLADVALNVVCFRYRPVEVAEERLNELNRELLMRLEESGIAVVSGTVLEGKFALRAAIVNHRSRKEDFQMLVDAVIKIGATVERDFCKKSL